MTLLELLVKELPQRGGWPEGAKISKSYSHITGVAFWDEYGVIVPYSDISNRVIGDDTVTDNQYEAAIAASKHPAWDGEGLPPVGITCEALTNGKWVKVKVCYVGEPGWKTEALVFDVKSTKPFWADEFRPIPTEAERKREGAAEAINSIIIDFDLAITEQRGTEINIAMDIVSAIAAGKIPGVKLA